MQRRKLRIVAGVIVAAIGGSVLAQQSLQAAYPTGNASVSGWVKDANGQAVPGVFIKVTDSAIGMTVSVLSQLDGSFRVKGLKAGKYDVEAQRQGYKAVRHAGVELNSATPEMNFTMEPGKIDPFEPGLSRMQWKQVLPEGKYKNRAMGCGGCHSLSGLTGRRKYDSRGWLSMINYMNSRELAGFVKPEDKQGVADYLASVFGPDAKPLDVNLTPDPVDERALDITYVQYSIPTPDSVSHTAVPDSKGNVWFTEYGGNKIGIINTKTGQKEEIPVPTPNALPHGMTIGKDGNVWFTEHASTAAKIAKLDVATKKITEYPVPQTGNAGSREGRPGPHTPLMDSSDMLWFTDTFTDFMRRMDPKTGEITQYPIKGANPGERANVYGMDIDAKGRIWFTAMDIDQVGYIDPATGKTTMFPMLTKGSGPRRVKVDSNGIAWSGLYRGSKLARIDPETGQVKEYDLPVANSQPYPLGIDPNGQIWLGTTADDKLVRFDPATEQFTTYPMPQRGNGLRDFFMDSDGWFWCVQMGHNEVLGFKVGG